MGSSGAQVLLTGVTGFVGKVVLEHLIREQEIYGIAAVHALIRPKRGNNPEERFTGKIAKSRCFENLPDGWTEPVKVVAGEMTEGDLGLNRADLDELTGMSHTSSTVQQPSNSTCPSRKLLLPTSQVRSTCSSSHAHARIL